jgi:2-oxoacid:acceptor oxidoreductase gamma subunit (pyruvate/2-ketoisovalerate family)
MKDIRFHGRGGQGAVTAVEMLTAAFVQEGKYSAGFPMFGFERRGAPVTAFVRYSDQPIRQKTKVYEPDCIVVIDRASIKSPGVFDGLKKGGVLVANIIEPIGSKDSTRLSRIGMIDATTVAMQEIGFAATNTTMLGAFSATTGWVSLDAVLKALEKNFEGEMLEKNLAAAKRGFKEVKITEF